MVIYPNKKIQEKKVKNYNMKMLRGIDLVKSIETGTNPPTDNERSKKKITKGVY